MATPAAAVTAPPSAPPSDRWLDVVNYYRATAYLPPVRENAALSLAAQKHAEYLVHNDLISHDEDPTLPLYSPAGAAAGRASNVGGGAANASPADMVEAWMIAPFHALGILRPNLGEVGFGIAHDNSKLQTAAVLDVIHGLTSPLPSGPSYPVVWPGNGTTQPLGSFGGGEYPNPLSSCPGYSIPTGLPLIVQFAGDVDVSAYSVKDASGTPLESCAIDGTNYVNADPGAQSLGRHLLSSDNAVIVIPRKPLVPGGTYRLSVTSNGRTAASTFSVTDPSAPSAPSPPPPSNDATDPVRTTEPATNGPRLSAVRALPTPCRVSLRSSCKILFTTDRPTTVTYRIKAPSGRVVYRRGAGALPAGNHVVRWDRRDQTGRTVRPATYTYELVAMDASSRTRRVQGSLRVTR